jgi:hypothetical protein
MEATAGKACFGSGHPNVDLAKTTPLKRASDYRPLSGRQGESYTSRAHGSRAGSPTQEDRSMFDADRPRNLVIHCFVCLAAVACGWALFSTAGHAYVRWLVTEKLPEVAAQTESQFDFSSPLQTNFDSSALGSGWGSAGGFNNE